MNNDSKSLPDIASQSLLQGTHSMATPLQWVGMSGIEMPIQWVLSGGDQLRVPAKIDAFVSLDQPEARGIHMSRLFKVVQESLSQSALSWIVLKQIVNEFLVSHGDLSKDAKVNVHFEAMVMRKALKSQNQGWRNYPVHLSVESKGGQVIATAEVLVTYSSTCPASAALARQLVQENFKAHFGLKSTVDPTLVYSWLGSTQGLLATPHAQRSFAKISVQSNLCKNQSDGFGALDFVRLIELIEEALQTPVQTVVKREDEQEFALRNGQNLMFCEDAARRLKVVLSRFQSQTLGLIGFFGEVRHAESLHPHDAVSFFNSDNHSHLP